MTLNKYIAPCKTCQLREIGCHDHCEKFQVWRKLIAKVAEGRRKDIEKRRHR